MKRTWIITIGVLALNLLCGCINSRGEATNVNVCEDPSKVAIAPANKNPDVALQYDADQSNIDLSGPAKGVLKGTMYGFGFFGECAKGASGDAAAFVLPVCFLAVPTGAVVGGLTGIFSGDTEVTLTHGEPPRNIINEVIDTRINSHLTNLLLDRFGKASNTSFVLGEQDEKNYYFPNFSSDLDVAILVNVYSIDFIGYDDLWGDFQIIVNARADFFTSDDDQSRVYSHELFTCKGEKRTLIEWSSDSFSELHRSLNECLDKFAIKIEDHYKENCDSWCQSITPVSAQSLLNPGDRALLEFKDGSIKIITISAIDEKTITGYYDYYEGADQVSETWGRDSIITMKHVKPAKKHVKLSNEKTTSVSTKGKKPEYQFKPGDYILLEFKDGSSRKIQLNYINDKVISGHYEWGNGRSAGVSYDLREIKNISHAKKDHYKQVGDYDL